jgi:hypothetical protein
MSESIDTVQRTRFYTSNSKSLRTCFFKVIKRGFSQRHVIFLHADSHFPWGEFSSKATSSLQTRDAFKIHKQANGATRMAGFGFEKYFLFISLCSVKLAVHFSFRSSDFLFIYWVELSFNTRMRSTDLHAVLKLIILTLLSFYII